jgi:hypothetical protein
MPTRWNSLIDILASCSIIAMGLALGFAFVSATATIGA